MIVDKYETHSMKYRQFNDELKLQLVLNNNESSWLNAYFFFFGGGGWFIR